MNLQKYQFAATRVKFVIPYRWNALFAVDIHPQKLIVKNKDFEGGGWKKNRAI